MNRALIRRYNVGGFDQDLEHQMLQTEIEYRLQRSNIPRDFFSAQHKDEPKENLAEELAKTLTIDTAKVDPPSRTPFLLCGRNEQTGKPARGSVQTVQKASKRWFAKGGEMCDEGQGFAAIL